MYEADRFSPGRLAKAFVRVVTVALILALLVGGSAVALSAVSPSSLGFAYHGQLVDQSASPTLAPGGIAAYTMRYRNTGLGPWQRGTNRQVTLGVSGDSTKYAEAGIAVGWLSQTRVATTAEDVVLPGMIGTFTFTVRAPATAGVYRIPLRPVVDGLTWLDDVPAVVVLTSDLGFHSQLVGQSDHPILKPGESRQVTITLRNTGARTWVRGAPNQQVNLGVAGDDKASASLGVGWPSANRVAMQLEPTVAPGGIATFTFKVRGPLTPGVYPLRLQAVADGVTWLDDNGLISLITVLGPADSPDKFQIPAKANPGAPSFASVSTVDPAALTAGSTVDIKASFTSATATNAIVGIEVFAPDATTLAYQKWFDNESFGGGETRVYAVTWPVPAGAAPGNYTVNLRVFSPGWKTLLGAKPSAAQFAVSAPTAATVGPTATATLAPSSSAGTQVQPQTKPATLPAGPPPRFTTTTTVGSASVATGSSIGITASVVSATAITALIDIEVFAPGSTAPIYQVWFDNQTFASGGTLSYPATWAVPAGAALGTYSVGVGVYAPAWATRYSWTDTAATFAVTIPPVPTPAPITAATATPTPVPTATAIAGPSLALRAQGNRLVNAAGQTVVLHGVNIVGPAHRCSQGLGIFAGPADDASVKAIKAWGTNAVRIGLNEQCWLGINGSPAAFSGANYQNAIRNYVSVLNANGMYAVLNLMWSGPGSTLTTGQQPMADIDHAPDFWTSVATAFKGSDKVIFELFSDPYPDNEGDTAAAWTCWRDGGTCNGVPFQAAGMQTLVNAVRAAGAPNVVLLGGVSRGNALSRWPAYKPNDPLNNLGAAWRAFSFSPCSNTACYDSNVAPTAAQVPLVATAIGTDSCDAAFVSTVTSWLDAKNAGYTAHVWETWGDVCSSIALIKDYTGAPTQYGQLYRNHLIPPPPATPTPVPTVAATLPPATGLSLRVQGNRFVNSAGQFVALHGVNIASAAHQCSQGFGIMSASDDAAVKAIKSWRTNAVRVELNEHCWLGINGAPAAYSGATYRTAIKNYVNLLNANGMYAILNLMWSGPGTTLTTGQEPMADVDHAPDFWTSVANTFKGNDAVIFELFNEPWPDFQADSVAAWTCWRDGGSCNGVAFQAAGMQTLVNAVRATGATNVLALGGVSWANALSRWVTYKPNDPLNNLAAAWHAYEFNVCSSVACYDQNTAPAAAQVPVIATEIGTETCSASFMNMVMGWLDAKNQNYTAHAWEIWGTACSSMGLITDYAGTPTPYGQLYKSHLAILP